MEPVDDNRTFYDEVDQITAGINTVNANIAQIESLHQRTLVEIDAANSAQTHRQLEQLVADTSSLNASLTQRVRVIKTKAAKDPTKAPAAGMAERSFKEALRNYQMVEKTFADRTREQMARQYRIVKPEASEEEVREACEGSQGQQIFSQAVSWNRRNWSRFAG